MALPQLNSAKYELTLPSTGERVEFRPFLVKEEKVLMMAQQSGKEEDMLRAVKDIITSCTFEKLDASKLPFFDLEYMFLQLRAKSVGETVDVTVTCPDDNVTKVDVTVNIEQIECNKELGHDNNIKLTDDIGIIMDYPIVNNLVDITNMGETEAAFAMIKKCIRQVYDMENVYEKNDMEDKELDGFIDSMTHDQFQKIQVFFNTMPKVKHLVKVKNPNTGVESEVVLQGLNTFF